MPTSYFRWPSLPYHLRGGGGYGADRGRSGGGAFRQGAGIYTGIVWRIHDRRPEARTVKTVAGSLYGAPLVDAHRRALWRWIADYYMCTLGEVMRMALPPLLKPSGRSEEEFSARGLPAAHRSASRRLHPGFATLRVCTNSSSGSAPCARSSMRRCSRSPMRPAIRSAARCRRGCSEARVRAAEPRIERVYRALRAAAGVRTSGRCALLLPEPRRTSGRPWKSMRAQFAAGCGTVLLHGESPVRARPKSTSTLIAETLAAGATC